MGFFFLNILAPGHDSFFLFKTLQRKNCRHLTKVSVYKYFFLYIFFTKTSFMFAKAFRFFMSGTLIILRQNCRNPDF